MHNVRLAASVIVALAVAPHDPGRAQATTEHSACPTSQLIRDTAPHDANADPVGPADWYMNEDRTMWAGPVPTGGWSTGGRLQSGGNQVPGHKTYWVRPQGTELVISGRRMDATAPPIRAHIPCCYPTGFQIVALHFPTPGCWEVKAEAGESRLRFVTHVVESVANVKK